jgi:tetratricopeptide (TPR) repeat protein
VALAVRSYQRNKPLCFFIAFFLVMVAPTSNLVVLIGSIMAERFLYLPSIGFAGCAVIALHWACRKLTAAWPQARLAPPIALAAICAAMASRAYARNADWLDGDSLWTSAVRSAPASYKTHLNLAITALGNQPPNLDLAAHELETSLAITGVLPDDRQNEYPYLMAGMCYRIKGETLAPSPQSDSWYARSLEALEHAERIDRILAERGGRDQPLRGPQAPMTGTAAIYEQLGHTYLRIRQPSKAVAAFAHSRLLSPELHSFAGMAAAYTDMGDLHRAIVTLLEGLVAFPNQTGFAPQAARLYAQMDPQSCAARGGGSSLNRECPLVQGDLCAAGRNVIQLYTQAGRPQEAAAVRLRVVNGPGCAVE